MHRAAATVLALAALLLAACIILPLPPLGRQTGVDEIGRLQPGVSTRADLTEWLGEPSHSVTDRYEIFDVSKEKGHLLFLFLPAVFFEAAGMHGGGGEMDRLGEQDFRILVEYRPDGVVESLHWEGLVADAQAPEGRRYISSHTEPTGPDASATPSGGPRPILTWHDGVPAADTMDDAVVAAPEGARVAVIDQTARIWWKRTFNRIVFHDMVTGRVLADYGDPAGCPELELSSLPLDLVSTVFLSDGRHMVSMAEGIILCVWDNQTGRRVLTFEEHRKRWVFGLGMDNLLTGGNFLISLVSARSAPIVATADADNIIRVWNGLSGLELAVLEPCSSGPRCRLPWRVSIGRPALSDDGRVLATFQTGELKDVVRLWDISTRAELGTIAMSERTGLVPP